MLVQVHVVVNFCPTAETLGLQAMNTRINHTSERLSPEFPSGKIAKNQLYYYRCFRFGREVRKMLRVMLADL